MTLTIQDLGALGELVGSVAVLATLVYLAVQVRHSGKLIEHQIHQSSFEQWAHILGLLGGSPQVSELCVKGLRSFSALSESEQMQFQSIFQMGLDTVEHRYLLSSDPDDDPLLPTLRNIALYWVAHPGGRECWEASSGYFSESFSSWIATILRTLDAVDRPARSS